LDSHTGICYFMEAALLIELSRLSNAWLCELAREYRVCGAQLAIQHHDEIVTAETGELEYQSGRPVTSDIAFPVGSITKAFTATLAMILVADGDADLDMPLIGLLPELGATGGRLTLRRLLSHTAGLACDPDLAELPSGSPRRYAADICAERNLVQPPGVGFSYSNLGYVLVGWMIEAITGMTWQDAMETVLLKPLGIESAFIHAAVPEALSRAVAVGHTVATNPERTRPVRQSLEPVEAPAGALAVSARDLLELGGLHLPPGSPWLLPPDHARLMRGPVAEAADPAGLADGWGLGLALFAGDGTVWAGHDGNADGTSCHLRIDPAGEWAVALTTNTGTGMELWRRLCGVLIEAGVPLPDSSHANVLVTSWPLPADCAGQYANGDAEYVVTGPDGHADGCWSLTADCADFRLLPSGDDLAFVLLDSSTRQRLPGGRFRRDPVSGRITGIQVGGRVARRLKAGGRLCQTRPNVRFRPRRFRSSSKPRLRGPRRRQRCWPGIER
jgi:CubicO group peptidase (beta-lactamase class C family)